MQINNLLIDKLNQLKGIKCDVTKEELENPSNFVCSMLDNRPISETLDLIAKHLHCINCSYDEIIYLNKLQMCFKANDTLALYSKCTGYKSINGRKNFFEIFEILKQQQVFSESNDLIFALDDREEEKLRWVNV